LIQNQFDFSHVGIYLMDGNRKYAILRAATGEAGGAMKSDLHRVESGSPSTVGWVAANLKPHLIQGRGDARFRDPLLPETRSELAIPLIVQNRLSGVLDIHSTQEDAFSEEDITILRILADQIAIAVENARLFQESQMTLSEMEKIQTSYTQEAWDSLRQASPALGYQYDLTGVKPIQGERSNNGGGHPESSETQKPVSIPLQVRGKVIGTLDVWPEEDELSPEKLNLLQAVGERLSQSMESVRLYEETVHRAEHEQMVGDITVKLRETLDIDTILQTAAREFRKALALAEVEVRLGKVADHGNQE
jgi:GAF domain-containing protein